MRCYAPITGRKATWRCPPADGSFTVSSVTEVNLGGFLMVDALTAAGPPESSRRRPTRPQWGSASPKEGISLFGLMDSCVTTMGYEFCSADASDNPVN